MPEDETDATTVPNHIEHGGLVWNLIRRGNGTWGIQQGLSHQGELVHELDASGAYTWRVVTKTIPYSEPDLGFDTWSAAVEHFLTAAGPDAIDGHVIEEEGEPAVNDSGA